MKVDLKVEKAKELIAQKQYDNAENILRKVLNSVPGNKLARFELGKLYHIKKKYKNSIDEYKKNLEIQPDHIESHIEIAEIYRESGKNSLAIKKCKEIIAKGCNAEKVHMLLGGLFYVEGQYDSAIRIYRTVLEKSKNKGKVLTELGKAYKNAGKYKSAKEAIKKAIEAGYETADIHKERGDIYRKEDRNALAIKEYEKALSMNYSENDIHRSLAEAYKEVGNYELALQKYEKARLFEKNGNLLVEIAKLYEMTGDYGKALDSYSRAKLDNGDENLIKEGEIRVYFKDKTEKMLSSKKSNSSRILELKNKEITEEIQKVKKRIAKGKKEYKDYFSLGRLYRGISERNLAIKAFRTAARIRRFMDNTVLQNQILNEIEITQGKIVLESMPQILKVTLTDKCDLRCIMCDYWMKKKYWDISAKKADDIIQLMPYLQEISWEGGEVFLSRHFKKLFDKACSNPHLRQHITTHGLLINDDWADRLMQGNTTIVFSIDGATRKTYEGIRKGAKFENLLRSIELLHKHRNRNRSNREISIEINYVVMKSNYKEIEKMLEFAKKYNFDALKLSPVERINSKENIFFHSDKKALEYIENIRDEIQSKAEEYKIKLNNWLPKWEDVTDTVLANQNSSDTSRPSEKQIKNSSAKKKDICREQNRSAKENIDFSNLDLCLFPWKSLYISAARTIRPQCYCPIDIGEMKEKSLMEIWNNKKMQMYRKKLLSKSMAWCDYKCFLGLPQKEFNWTIPPERTTLD